jgi:ATP-dependent Clp protease ATP-binding subunit ClpX
MDPLDRETFNFDDNLKCVNQTISKFLMDEVEFSITDEALDFIVDKALEYKLGSWIAFVMRGSLNRCHV